MDGIIDLRKFAADCNIRAPGRTDESGFPAIRHFVRSDDARLDAGVATLLSESGQLDSVPIRELFILLNGELKLLGAGDEEIVLRAGDAIVLPKGQPIRWSGRKGSTWVFFRFSSENPDADPAELLALIVPTPPMTTSAPPSADVLLTPAPTCFSTPTIKVTPGDWTVGVWDATPYTRRAVTFVHHELMYVRHGSVTIGDGEETETLFRSGDIFLVLKGAKCSWSSTEYFRKIYCTLK